MKVKKLHKMHYSGVVHNISVEDNHNYVADGLLVSNCHSAKTYSINKIGKMCDNAEYRIGFTGTLQEDMNDLLNIESVIGPELINVKSDEGIEMGVISPISIVNILLKHKQNIVNEIFDFDKQIKDINKYIRELKDVDGSEETVEGYKEQRTKVKQRKFRFESDLVKSSMDRMCVFDWIFSKIPKPQNNLILMQHIEQVKNVEQYLIDNLDDDYKVFIIYGEIKTEQREAIRKLVETEENLIIVSTYKTMSTGLNMKKLHNVIFASSYKSKITILQSIGRGLRKSKDKQKMVLWDVIDDLSYSSSRGNLITNYLYEHFRERLKYYVEQKFNFKTIKLEIDKLI